MGASYGIGAETVNIEATRNDRAAFCILPMYRRKDVEKVAADCDRWQFNGASFTVDGEDYPVYTYATAATPADGLTAEIVYVGQGTMWDYEGLDVTGKIVLVDINQRDDWWITCARRSSTA